MLPPDGPQSLASIPILDWPAGSLLLNDCVTIRVTGSHHNVSLPKAKELVALQTLLGKQTYI